MDVSQETGSREAVDRLRDWLHEGPDLYRQFLDHLRVLQEQASGGQTEIEHWRRLAEAAQEESEQLRQELLELQAENERLRKQREEWDGMIGSVNETTRRMNEMISKLRGSRGKGL